MITAMEEKIHPYRSMIVAGLGLVTAVAMMAGTVIFLESVPPKEGDRTYRVDAEHMLSLLLQTGALELPAGEYVLRDPLETYSILTRHFHKADPSLAEGIDGILEQKLFEATGKTGIEHAIRDLASKGMTVTILPQDDRLLFACIGQGAGTALVEEWFLSAMSSRTSGQIRTLALPHGNIRRDILAASAPITEENGWKILGQTASGQLIIAVSGNRFAMSNDTALLRQSLAGHTASNRLQLSLQEGSGSAILRLRALR